MDWRQKIKMEIKVFSRELIEQGMVMELQEKEPNKKFAVVSITDSHGFRTVNVLSHPDRTWGILRLRFDDVGEDYYAMGEIVERAIEVGQARLAAKFLFDAQEAGVNVMVVHCEAGISRSSGMAGAFCILLGQKDWEFFNPPFCPNMTVYRTVLNEGIEDPRFKRVYI